jgi:asparagine synthase (glutamine-hydrolysing)
MTPVDIAIGNTLWFIAETANEQGYACILSGQRADELFGGYHRYADLSRHGDASIARVFLQVWATIAHQNIRDQMIAGAHGSWFSMPYLDTRVVEFCKSIAPSDHLMQGIRKYQLRNAARSYLPSDIVWQNKKAMQYGTGIAHELKRLAKSHGCGGVAEYVAKIANNI